MFLFSQENNKNDFRMLSAPNLFGILLALVHKTLNKADKIRHFIPNEKKLNISYFGIRVQTKTKFYFTLL